MIDELSRESRWRATTKLLNNNPFPRMRRVIDDCVIYVFRSSGKRNSGESRQTKSKTRHRKRAHEWVALVGDSGAEWMNGVSCGRRRVFEREYTLSRIVLSYYRPGGARGLEPRLYTPSSDVLEVTARKPLHLTNFNNRKRQPNLTLSVHSAPLRFLSLFELFKFL